MKRILSYILDENIDKKMIKYRYGDFNLIMCSVWTVTLQLLQL